MQKFGYRLIIATKGRAVFSKPYENDIRYNQILCLYYDTKGRKSNASIEITFNDKYLTQSDLDTIQIALNRTKKDLKEYGELLLKELEELCSY